MRREQQRPIYLDSARCATDARMKLVITLVVRNEAEIIEANIDYHLAQGVDFVLVTDHGSDDGTSEILARYEREGVAQVIRDDREGHRQSERVTRMVRIAAEQYSADWVINSDADEFWWPLAGSLRDVFASVPDDFGQIAVQLRHFLPLEDDSGEFYTRLLYRERQSLDLSESPTLPKIAHRPRKDVRVAPGNHALFVDGLRMVPAGELIEILHFPMRNFEQFERKVLQTGLGYEKLGPDSPEVGRDQMLFLEMHRAGELPAYFHGRILDEENIERGLRDGSVVLDDRLARFMSTLREGTLPRTPPDSVHARALFQRTLQAPLELEQCQWDLMQQERELTSAKDQIRLLGEARDAHQAQAAELSERLDKAQHALHILRESRLMRWTEPARRAFYRARGYPRR
jgi:Glycosyl transferase family 2